MWTDQKVQTYFVNPVNFYEQSTRLLHANDMFLWNYYSATKGNNRVSDIQQEGLSAPKLVFLEHEDGPRWPP